MAVPYNPAGFLLSPKTSRPSFERRLSFTRLILSNLREY
ncbi:hypothetical protein C1G86_1190 [Dehalococcoides mccartyi]|uniref:Uncharacterized protein n=1 Tax=Dehalococcoides mccartyi TaxID=61435 RepID=A0A328ENT2_9CHLR|nr:hypothetical protein C1G86_1190 [Dehalococcoides mccartyi]